MATSVTTITPPETAYGTIADTSVAEVAVATVEVTTQEDIVRSYFRDIPVMAEIARCESTFRQTLPNGEVLRGKVDSDDTGIMQINRRYHGVKAAQLELDLNDIYHNMAYARYLYETQGTQPWSASAPCWNKNITIAANI
ncbi:hypothetical protein K2Q16_01930 [Patescibacteria group bacterium]|nr:hypothetical protein [Patescibacteria group bacterium]